MWISQTYLGSPDPNSKVFLYYFWEDYAQQKEVPAKVLQGLSDLGYDFRDQVSAYAPMDSYLGLIREEMRGKFNHFWQTFSGKTPGIFLCRKSLRDFDPQSDDWLFFEVTDQVLNDEKRAIAFFSEIHRTCREIIAHEYDSVDQVDDMSLMKTLYESAQLRLTFMGAGIDFKPMLARFARRRSTR